jgi:hypothetical protein
MFKLAVWIVAIALQTAGFGITATRAADEQPGFPQPPVPVTAVAQSMVPATKNLHPSPSRPTNLSTMFQTKSARQSRRFTPYIARITNLTCCSILSDPGKCDCVADGQSCSAGSTCCNCNSSCNSICQ